MSDDKASKFSTTRREKTSTEQPQHEELLKAREYLDLAEVMFVALGSEGVVVFINHKCSEVLGYNHAEIIGKDWFKTFIPKRLRKEIYRTFTNLMKGKIKPVEHFENPVLTKDGEEKIIAWRYTVMKNSEGLIDGIFGAGEDITERHRVVEALRESEVRYRSLFDNTPVGLAVQEIVVDESGKPIDFVFIDANEGFEALMGLRKDDIIGKSASHVLTSDGKPGLDWIDVYSKVALPGARARFDQYSEALGRWFSVTAYSPKKNFFIVAYTDITEQKKAYESLKQQKKELSDFAHTMSHDLNSYFFKIRGSIVLLGPKGEIPEIHGIKLLIDEMSDLVQHSVVLADAGLIIDKKQKVDLARLVRDVAVRHLPEGIALVQGPLLSVMADEIKLIQIFLNLFKNAVEHGNPTTVEVQRYDSKDGIRIVVANNGKPIPDDLKPHVFRRGFTTREKSKGYGLSIVKKLVEAHGWQIKLVDTRETEFEILIPTAAG